MGYWNARTPDEVQHNNGTRFTFDTLAERYAKVKPLQGKRKSLDVRPMSERSRDWERVVKVSDNEYYLTNTAYRYFDTGNYNGNATPKHCRAITFTRNEHDDVLTIHTPRRLWNNHEHLAPHQFVAPSTFYFYDYNLPSGFRMFKHKAQNYVGHRQGDGSWLYFTAQKGDIKFTQKHGETEWKPLFVRRETIHKIDRKKAKEVRAMLKPFQDYCMTMVDIVEPKHDYGNQVLNSMNTIETDNWEDVFKQVGDDTPEHWFNMLQHYKHHAIDFVWSYDRTTGNHTYTKILNKDQIIKQSNNHAFQVAKPCKEVDVPLGEMCKDRYQSWF